MSRSALLLGLSLPLLVLGCDLLGGEPGDDDDSAPAGDDDDDSAPTGDDDDATASNSCSQLGAPGVVGTVPCDFELGGDVWQFIAVEGDEVSITLDTVSAETTFDPRFVLLDAVEAYLGTGDDECECAFPPPDDYGCGEAEYTAEFAAEQLRVHVAGFIETSCVDGTFGEYVLRISVNGEPIVPALSIDDGPTFYSSD